MKKLSLVTVYNDRNKLEEMLNSAKKQIDVDIQYILINNDKNQFSSASKALNYGISKITGDVVIFLHQDIEFLDESVLEKAYDFAIKNPYTVFGAAGIEDKNKVHSPKSLSNMKGAYNTRIGELSKPTKAFTLDECLIGCNVCCLKDLKFDEKICDGWHLYGADFCLQAQISEKYDVVALPMNVYHKSNGNADKSYFVTQNKLGRKYKKYFKYINTTNGYVYTNKLMQILQNAYRKVRYFTGN